MAAFALLAVLAAACGGSGGGTPSPPPVPTVTIGVIVPESGSLGSVGRAMVAGVRLAVSEAKTRNALGGWKIRVDAEDDQARADAGARAAGKLAQDDTVIGVVGPMNSTVALTAAPVLAQAGIPLVSPAASDVTLTDAQASAHRTRPYRTFFRLVPTDESEGPVAAGYAVGTLHARRLVVISEDVDYERRMADDFAAAARRTGATTLPTEVLPAGSGDGTALRDAVGRVEGERPTAVFVAATAPTAAAVVERLLADDVTVPVIGSDDLRTPQFLDQAGSSSDGVYAVDLGAPADSTPAGRDLLARLSDAGGPSPGTTSTDAGQLHGAATAYDAATVLLRAAGAALGAGTAPDGVIGAQARAAALRAVQATSLTGVTGPVSFDAYGDRRYRALTVYRAQDGAFSPVRTETLR